MKPAPGSKFLFIGDSITDAGRDPSGEHTPWGAPGTGRGYVSLIEAWLIATRPDQRIRVINRGVSGNTARDLAARWDADVLALKPDWLSVMIGINDVWRQFDTPLRTDLHVGPDEYEHILEGLLVRTRGHVRGLVLATPFMIEPSRGDAMRRRMDEYGGVVRRLAARHEAIFIDTQAAFDAVLEHVHPMSLAWDRIHPGTAGHLILARAFLRALDAL